MFEVMQSSAEQYRPPKIRFVFSNRCSFNFSLNVSPNVRLDLHIRLRSPIGTGSALQRHGSKQPDCIKFDLKFNDAEALGNLFVPPIGRSTRVRRKFPTNSL